MQFREHVPLAPYTTFGIGGPARWFAEAVHEDEALEAVRFARERSLPLFLLGGGSNLLVSDEGFPGLVLHLASKGIEQNGGLFRAAAGENWDSFVSHAVSLGYAGIECLAGIPGTVGGTPVQNVGAYGQEVAETIVRVRTLDLETLAFTEMEAADCAFAYRRSLFNSTARGRYLVTRVDYRLTHNGQPRLNYADLKKYFVNQPKPSLVEVATAVRAIRREKGMLLVDGDPDCRSAGSFFKNPVISAGHYARLATAHGSAIPSYPAHAEHVKLPAAWLLDQAGFHKGFAQGRAGISSRHTLALINRGNATAADILALRDTIIAAVEAKFGIPLEPEPVWLGPSHN
ncbi:UDP-N-acetylmuramate dehydrogenase [Silvibacterium dinghuense]|uniref:UDP-N-acetylenolpyruvoylglucosamine reductase n=1 Tax=Silvibacterium dinghuense TaxID=1560006 RepID=A0A4Q1SHF7_9BACT|nr:UDP-N-acetylmuramate dehydrogenase [Silvibacterium dinghuense]RXS96986.1 UDP-N-acetylmuramate dehydrogenase [Silvibacterium dinghuense]GGG95246.1 UDP-N-acetylenolpyruvoylglucosamine reductase [Silvibacterium dinghuense]